MIDKGLIDALCGVGATQGNRLVVVAPAAGQVVRQAAAVGHREVGATLGGAVALGVEAVERQRLLRL